MGCSASGASERKKLVRYPVAYLHALAPRAGSVLRPRAPRRLSARGEGEMMRQRRRVEGEGGTGVWG